MRSPAVCLNDNTLMEKRIKSGSSGKALSSGYEKKVQLDTTDISRQFSELTKYRSSKQEVQNSERKSRLEELKRKHSVVVFYCAKCGYAHEVSLKCRNWRTCEYCRMREALRLRSKYIQKVNSIEKCRLRLVTLTTKNTKKLTKSTIKRIRRYLIALLHSKAYKKVVVGGLYSIEVVCKGRGWNTHIHLLLEVINKNVLLGSKKYKKHTRSEQKLSENWFRITGGSAKIVDIKNVYSPSGGLNYLLKYLSKAPAVAGEKYTYNEVLKDTRTLSTIGSWYSLIKEVVKQVFLCPVCGGSYWISEFDIRKGIRRLYEVNTRSP